jgi:hypothetical protein
MYLLWWDRVLVCAVGGVLECFVRHRPFDDRSELCAQEGDLLIPTVIIALRLLILDVKILLLISQLLFHSSEHFIVFGKCATLCEFICSLYVLDMLVMRGRLVVKHGSDLLFALVDEFDLGIASLSVTVDESLGSE